MMASSIHTQFVYSADFATEVVKGADGRNWSGHGTLPGLHSVQHSEMIEAQQYRSRLEAAYASDEKPPWLRERLARQTTSALYSTAAVRKRLGGGGPASALDYAKAAAAEAEVKKEVQAMVARAMRAVEARTTGNLRSSTREDLGGRAFGGRPRLTELFHLVVVTPSTMTRVT